MTTRLSIKRGGQPLLNVMRHRGKILETAWNATALETGDRLKRNMRKQMARAFPKSKKIRTIWGGKFYPNKGDFLGAASTVFPRKKKSKSIIEGLQRGLAKVPVRARALAIPTQAVRKLRRNRFRLTPHNWPVAKYGPLVKVETGNGEAVLIAPEATETGGRVRASRKPSIGGSKKTGRVSVRTQRGAKPLVAFVLRRSVRGKKQIDTVREFEKQRSSAKRGFRRRIRALQTAQAQGNIGPI